MSHGLSCSEACGILSDQGSYLGPMHWQVDYLPLNHEESSSHCLLTVHYIKDRNGMDLTEAEDIKKRWQEYTEELYKKDLHDPDITMV